LLDCEFTNNTSVQKACFSSIHEFMEIGTTTSRGERSSLLEESQRSINNESAIGTKNFES
jgi:hypothetical protein